VSNFHKPRVLTEVPWFAVVLLDLKESDAGMWWATDGTASGRVRVAGKPRSLRGDDAAR